MENKHTPEDKAAPRPWVYEEKWNLIVNASGNSIARTVNDPDHPMPNRANAELIVTAVNERDELRKENERLKKDLNAMQASRNEMDQLWKEVTADKAELAEALQAMVDGTRYMSITRAESTLQKHKGQI